MAVGAARAGVGGVRLQAFDPLATGAAVTLSKNYNRIAPTPGNGNYGLARSKRAHAAGSNQRRYFEIAQDNMSPTLDSIVIGPGTLNLNQSPSAQAGGHVTSIAPGPGAADDLYLGSAYQGVGSFRGGLDVIGVLVVLFTTRTEVHFRNLTQGHGWTPSDPAAGAGQLLGSFVSGSPVHFYLGAPGNQFSGAEGWEVNVGQKPFVGALPSGSVAWR